MAAVDAAIQAAMRELGRPYVYGAEGPSSFDCSGLVQFAFGNAGIHLPRTSQEQQKATTPVTNPLPGDLVFYGSPAYHVGIYIGGGKMIDAPDTGSVVRIQNVWGKPTYGRVPGAGTALAPIVTPVVDSFNNAASGVAGWLGGTKYIVVEIAFVGLGLALIGAGVYRSVAPAVKKQVGEIL